MTSKKVWPLELTIQILKVHRGNGTIRTIGGFGKNFGWSRYVGLVNKAFLDSRFEVGTDQ